MKLDWKQALISVFIGACIAFFTTFFNGLESYINSPESNVLAGTGAAAWYFLKKAIHPFA